MDSLSNTEQQQQQANGQGGTGGQATPKRRGRPAGAKNKNASASKKRTGATRNRDAGGSILDRRVVDTGATAAKSVPPVPARIFAPANTGLAPFVLKAKPWDPSSESFEQFQSRIIDTVHSSCNAYLQLYQVSGLIGGEPIST